MPCLSLHKACSQLPFILCRQATTASASHTDDSRQHPYPFPKHRHPTPFEIFHLPIGASSTEIKSRYYDLVRYHHPDSPIARSHTPSHAVRNSQFQSILSAYNSLRYPNASRRGAPPRWYGHGPGFDPYMAELNRRRRGSQYAEYTKRRRAEYEAETRRREQEEFERSSRGPKERLMVVFAIVALTAGIYPSFFIIPSRMEGLHQDAVRNLKKARSDAQEVGHLRREEMRKRAKDMKTNGPAVDE